MSALGTGVGSGAPSRPRAGRGPVPVTAAALAAATVSILAWLAVNPRTPDLAAQVYRSQLYDRAGFVLWDNHWYAGHHLPGYSLLFGPLAHLLGLRAVGVLAVLGSALLFGALMGEHFPERAAPASAWWALGASADLWIGRLTFALGVTFGLAAVLSLSRRRLALAALGAALCSAASPVAGLFVVLAAGADLLVYRRPGRALALGGPALGVAAGMTLLFPEGGQQPFAATSVAATLAAALTFVVLISHRQRLLRVGGMLYLAAVLASVLIPTPMGSNVARLGVLCAGPLLFAAQDRHLRPSRWRRPAMVLAGAALALWAVWGPVRELHKVARDPSVRVAYYAPVQRFLDTHLASPARVEVPFTRAHWEAAVLGGRYPLARGWERQLDRRYDGLFFDGHLTSARYHAWLRENAVRYVALPDVHPDVSGAAEAALVADGVPYLRPVLRSAHWRVYELTDPLALADGGGVVGELTRDGFTLRVSAAGAVKVRVHYTRYWALLAGAGCVGPAPGGWTLVRARAPGELRVGARFSLARALGGGSDCRA